MAYRAMVGESTCSVAFELDATLMNPTLAVGVLALVPLEAPAQLRSISQLIHDLVRSKLVSPLACW